MTMPARAATPEETRAFFGSGKIMFGTGLRPPPGYKRRKKKTDVPPPEPSTVPAESAEEEKTE